MVIEMASFVTPAVTKETLLLHRKAALNLIKEDLVNLAKKSQFLLFLILYLLHSLNGFSKANALGEVGENAIKRNHYEPWRQFVNLMICQLENTISENFIDSKTYYKSSKDLEEDLKTLREILVQNGKKSIAEDLLFSVERSVKCFGFHLAKLDIRQNSAFHDKAVSQILKKMGETDYDFENWEEEKE